MDERVSEISEFALIERLRDALPESALVSDSVSLGIGDDAAIWQPTPGHVSVITTDALTEGIHFRLDWADWRSLGFKALAVNLSDIAAMGAKPVLATVTLGLTGKERVPDLEDLYRGLGDLAGPHRVAIAGGDIVRSPAGLMLSVTVIGEVAQDRVLLRSGAKPGDLVAVSGSLGASAAGMALIQNSELAAKATTANLLIAAHLRPQPRLDLGQQLASFGVTAAMDLSDGLTGDLPKLLTASSVGARIEVERVPVLPAIRALFPDQWLAFALSGGEDYELLFTIPPDHFEALQQTVAQRGATVTAVGEIVEGSDAAYLHDGERFNPPMSAWDHFQHN